jgi:hypothetical protein
VGDAEEFRSLRDYRPGDPLRSIHWRSFARTGKPVVREFQEEFFSRHALVLDTAAPYPFAPAFEAAVSMAAWLVARPRDADSLLDLMFVGDRVHRLTAGRGLSGADALLRVLATVAPTPPENIAPLLATLERNAARVSSVIAIFLAWDAPRQDAVRHLLARGVRPTVLVVETDAAPVSDDSGVFFLYFYQSLLSGSSSAISLKAASATSRGSYSPIVKSRPSASSITFPPGVTCDRRTITSTSLVALSAYTRAWTSPTSSTSAVIGGVWAVTTSARASITD